MCDNFHCNFKNDELCKGKTLTTIDIHKQETNDSDTYSPKLVINFDSIDNQLYDTMINQFKLYLNKPTKSNFIYFKNIDLMKKEKIIELLKSLSEKDFLTIGNLIASESIEESDQAIEFVIKSLECCPSIIDIFSKYNYQKLCFECLPQEHVVDALKLFASINRESIAELDLNFLECKMNTYYIIYEKLAILVTCLQVFFEANVISSSFSEMFLSKLLMKIHNYFIIGETLQNSILSLLSILKDISHITILFSNNTPSFLMKNFTLFPNFEQRLLILKIIQNLIQEQFIESLFESEILYFLNIVFKMVEQMYIQENKSLLILSSLISIAIKITYISSKCRQLLSDSDFTQNLCISFSNWPYSHKIEILKYVSSFFDFIDEDFSYNLIVSFDIIPFLTDLLYSDDNNILEIALHIFIVSLNQKNNDRQIFHQLSEFAVSDEFHFIISELLNSENSLISNLSQTLQNLINEICI